MSGGGDGDQGRYVVSTWLSADEPTHEVVVAVAWPRMDIEATKYTVAIPTANEINTKIVKLWPTDEAI